LAVVLAIAGCAAPRRPADWLTVREVTPRFLDSVAVSDPTIAADPHGRAALTFVTRGPKGKDLWLCLSRDSGVTFSKPVRVNPEPGSVQSDSEGRPIAAYGPGGAFAIAWTEQSAAEGSSLDLVVRASGDGGNTLGTPAVVNDEWRRLEEPGARWAARKWLRALEQRNEPIRHGLPALSFLADGSLFAAWLDERHFMIREADDSAFELFCAVSPDGGQTWPLNSLVSENVSASCRPDAVSDAAGRVAVAYRSSADGVRDPALAVSLDGGRSFALDTVISADHWFLEECPQDGPALTFNRAGGGHYAWRTRAAEPRVYLVPWRVSRGAAGVKRTLSDSLFDAARPRLTALGTATLAVLEARPLSDTSRTVLALRALDVDGTATPWSFFGADVEQGWISGVDARSALACWLEREDDRRRLRVARFKRRT